MNENHDAETGQFTGPGAIKRTLNTILGVAGGAAAGVLLARTMAPSILGHVYKSTMSTVERRITDAMVGWNKLRRGNYAETARAPTLADYGKVYEDMERGKTAQFVRKVAGLPPALSRDHIAAAGGALGGAAGGGGALLTNNSAGAAHLVRRLANALDEGDRLEAELVLKQWDESRFSSDPNVLAEMKALARG